MGRDDDISTIESRLMREGMIIVSIIIIGACVIWFYISNFLSDAGKGIEKAATGSAIETVESDASSASQVTAITATGRASQAVDTSNNSVLLSEENYEKSLSDGSSTTTKTTDTADSVERAAAKTTAKTLMVDSLPVNATSAANAVIAYYAGTIAADKQEDWYSFQAPYNGYYRLDLTGIQNGTGFGLYLYDELGNTVAQDSYCKNDEGITCKDLEAGRTYAVKIKQNTGYSNYILSIGMQKAPIDLTGYTSIDDSIEFKGQRNTYYFAVPVTGYYRFDFSGIYAGTGFEVKVLDSLGYTVASDSYCKNGEGVTCKDLQAGAIYEISVRQYEGCSSYTMNIGYQKNTADITGLPGVCDSIEYEDQRNIYLLKADRSGDINLRIDDMKDDVGFEAYVYNELGEKVASDSYFKNADILTINNCSAGACYEVQIRQYSGLGGYHIEVY